MFVSHYATGLVFYLKNPGNRLIFFFLVLGTQFVDVLWGLFTLIGIEGGISGGSVDKNYFDVPWSHSLFMMIVWSVVYGFGTDFYLKSREININGYSLLAGLAVFSHWLLDFLVHNDDMLIFPTSDAIVPSLYLWDFPFVAFLLEILIITICWFLYHQYLVKINPEYKNRSFGMLALLLTVHIVGYLPTFSDADGMEATAGQGIVVLIMLNIIAFVMLKIHPIKDITK